MAEAPPKLTVVAPVRAEAAGDLRRLLATMGEGIANGTVLDLDALSGLHFARLVKGAIARDLALPALQHVVPQDALSKARLLELFARRFDRPDVKVVPGPSKDPIDRTLATKLAHRLSS